MVKKAIVEAIGHKPVRPKSSGSPDVSTDAHVVEERR